MSSVTRFDRVKSLIDSRVTFLALLFMPAYQTFIVDDSTPPVIVAALRSWLPDHSWSKVRKLLRSRRVKVGSSLCMDEARKLRPGERVEVHQESLDRPPGVEAVKIEYVDRDIVVAEKPPRMLSVRHKKELNWHRSKKALQPTLEEVIPDLIYSQERKEREPLKMVHRIDRDTSGLLVFARSEHSQEALIQQFANHDVVRIYKAVVFGVPAHQTVRCQLIRNRGDGLRGSTDRKCDGKESVTHIRPQRTFEGVDGNRYTEIECQLETGRTHQIRIHLAELGHPVCGDPIYRSALNQEPIADTSGAPRLALHAAQLGFSHPTTNDALHFQSQLPKDLKRFIGRLEGMGGETSPEPAVHAKAKRAWK